MIEVVFGRQLAKQSSLPSSLRRLKLYPAERTEHTGAYGGPIQTANLHVHKMDLEQLEPEQRQQLRTVLLALKAQHERDSKEQATTS